MFSILKLFSNLASNLKLLFFIYCISLVLSTLAFAVLENQSLFNSFWWSCMTSLTIGYGDIAPQTIYCKILAVIFGHFWIFVIIPCIVANMITTVITDQNAFTHHEQEQIKADLDAIKNALHAFKDS